jgi:nuclear pore complex protein Nup98-Nup96
MPAGTQKEGTGALETGGQNKAPAKSLRDANGCMASNKTAANRGTSVRLPKLTQGGYYTVPCISELEKREHEEPGCCWRVKDFVVGREGYGSIMFYGETDVSDLDLDSIVEFGNREVVVYRDESSKPPMGQGLNKAAEVTLLNVKWVNKKTGQQYLEPDRVDKYTEMLKAKSVEQGAHFISYRAPQGEWKFKVDHF